jgi:hypothetical protein
MIWNTGDPTARSTSQPSKAAHIADVQRVGVGDVCLRGVVLTDLGAHQLGDDEQLVHGPAQRDAVAGHKHRSRRAKEHLGQLGDGAGVGPRAPAGVGRGANVDLGLLIEHIHRHAQEHWALGRLLGDLEGPA